MQNQDIIARQIAQLTVELNATQKVLFILANESELGTEKLLDMLDRFRALGWEDIEKQNPSFAAFASEGSTVDPFRDFKME